MPFEFPEVVDSMEDVPEEFKAGYAAGSGDTADKFIITGLAKNMAATIGSLNKTLSGTRSDKKKATDEAATGRLFSKSLSDLTSELGIEIVDEDLVASLKGHLGRSLKRLRTEKSLASTWKKSRQTRTRWWKSG